MASELPTLYQIEVRVRAAFAAPLPGAEAHLALAPHPRHGWNPGQVPAGSKAAAALVLLYPLRDAPHILLTVRAGMLAQHAGQVSLPGGKLDADETVEAAALREVTEEVGVDPTQVGVLGALSTLYIPVSDFALHPIVGLSDRPPRLHLGGGEVWRILEVPIGDLLAPNSLRLGTRWHLDRQYQVPYFELCDERVWGAAAMVLAELLAVLGAFQRNPRES